MEKVPAAGYAIKGLWISGIQRKLTFDNFSFPFKLFSSLWNSVRIVNRFKPDIVIGTGVASGPVLFVAASKNIPTLIQEQNSYPGITNKLLSKRQIQFVWLTIICSDFSEDKIVKTGNPVRQDLLDVATKKQAAQKEFSLDTTKKTLLVLGGSLGARTMSVIAENIEQFQNLDVQLIWQTGKFYIETYAHFNSLESVQVHAYLKIWT